MGLELETQGWTGIDWCIQSNEAMVAMPANTFTTVPIFATTKFLYDHSPVEFAVGGIALE